MSKRHVRYDDLARHAPTTNIIADIDSDLVIFPTSGTTSKPKFVLHTNRTILAHSHALAKDTGPSGYVSLQALPFCGIFGFSQAMAAIAAHGTLVVQSAWDAEQAAILLDSHEIAVCNGTDAMIAALLDAATERSLRRIRFSAYAAFDPGLANLPDRAERLGLKLVGIYGMSEIQGLFARRRASEPLDIRRMAGGFPILSETTVRIRDVETRQILGPGKSGEIEIRGGSVMKGYSEDPAATQSAVTSDGFFRTGDFGRTLDNGSLAYEARIGDWLRLSGFLVSPGEIEYFLQSHPTVDRAQVVAISTPDGNRAVAFVSARPGALVDAAALQDYCRNGLAKHKIPFLIEAIDTFPTVESPNGIKITKGRLRELAITVALKKKS